MAIVSQWNTWAASMTALSVALQAASILAAQIAGR
jgi:hypothetical protein